MSKIACVLLVLCLYCTPLFSQDSIPLLEKISDFPDKFFKGINNKAGQLEERIISDLEAAIYKPAKQEERLGKTLACEHSLAATAVRETDLYNNSSIIFLKG